MKSLENWQRDILDNQIAAESLYASEKPLQDMGHVDAICAASYRAKYTKDEMARRLRWLRLSYATPNLALSDVK
ncbi:hypothetical protein LZK73_18465 [Neorhizobium galegae]|nr:hypothetical protein LZK73_18465 [Neorhizobium galegae]